MEKIFEMDLPDEYQARYIKRLLRRAFWFERVSAYAVKIPLILLNLVLLVLFVIAVEEAEYVIAALVGSVFIILGALVAGIFVVQLSSDRFSYVPRQLMQISGMYECRVEGTGRTATINHYVGRYPFKYRDGLLRKAKVKEGENITILAYPPPRFVGPNWVWGNLMAIQINDVQGWR